VSFVAKVSAPAFDAQFLTPQQLSHGLEPGDLAALTGIEIEVDQVDFVDGPARIAVAITQPVRPSKSEGLPPVVKLTVTGGDRDWVDLAKVRMSDQVATGARQTGRVRGVMMLGVAAFAGLTILVEVLWSDNAKGLNLAEIVAIVLGSLAGCLLLTTVFLESITPQLELFPEGGSTRWERLKKRSRVSSYWLLDTALKAAIGAVIALLIARLL
jgi:hypothetical protein